VPRRQTLNIGGGLHQGRRHRTVPSGRCSSRVSGRSPSVKEPYMPPTDVHMHRNEEGCGRTVPGSPPAEPSPDNLALVDELESPTVRPAVSPVAVIRDSERALPTIEVPAAARAFGDFELLEEIGRGGMGVVYRAHQTSLDRIVAVKVLAAGQWASPEEVQRFREEATSAARLTHSAIVPIYEVGEWEGQPFLSMAYVRGSTLAERIRSGPLPAREAAELVYSVSDAVHYAHRCGVIHRDLKPANILLDSAGQPRVTDFGIAKRLEAPPELTGDGQVLGTPGYIPPEQAAGRLSQIDARSDVYALGAVLYAMLTGRPPFSAATSLDTLLQVLEREPVPPRQLNSAVPRDLETIALKCLEKEPRRRYPTALELADDLRRYLADEPVRAKPLRGLPWMWRWCRKNLLVASVSGIVALLITAVAGLTAAAYYREARARLQIEDEFTRLQDTANVDASELRRERQRRIAAEQRAAREGAHRIVAESRAARLESPQLGLLLALEAIELYRRYDLPVPAAAAANLSAAIEQQGVETRRPENQPRADRSNESVFDVRGTDQQLEELLQAGRRLAGRKLTAEERRQYVAPDW